MFRVNKDHIINKHEIKEPKINKNTEIPNKTEVIKEPKINKNTEIPNKTEVIKEPKINKNTEIKEPKPDTPVKIFLKQYDPIYNVYDPMDYIFVKDIKFYTKTTPYFNKLNNKQLLQYKTKHSIFTSLEPNTITAGGRLSNVIFHEEIAIKNIKPPSNNNILKISCNFGKIITEHPNYVKPIKEKKSNRGRKKKIRPVSIRKKQGAGDHMSSQLTFDIYTTETRKSYLIKLFRNDRLQIPGCLKNNISDSIQPILELCDYLNKNIEHFNTTRKKIQINYLTTIMRNYNCELINRNRYLIAVRNLIPILKKEKIKPFFNKKMEIYMMMLDEYSWKDDVNIFLGDRINEIDMAEIIPSSNLRVKFNRPIPGKIIKKTTIIIRRSGIVSIKGGNSKQEVMILYYWLQQLMTEHKLFVIYDTNLESDEDSSECSEDSIYDK
jgi:hypothetical protein